MFFGIQQTSSFVVSLTINPLTRKNKIQKWRSLTSKVHIPHPGQKCIHKLACTEEPSFRFMIR